MTTLQPPAHTADDHRAEAVALVLSHGLDLPIEQAREIAGAVLSMADQMDGTFKIGRYDRDQIQYMKAGAYARGYTHGVERERASK